MNAVLTEAGKDSGFASWSRSSTMGIVGRLRHLIVKTHKKQKNIDNKKRSSTAVDSITSSRNSPTPPNIPLIVDSPPTLSDVRSSESPVVVGTPETPPLIKPLSSHDIPSFVSSSSSSSPDSLPESKPKPAKEERSRNRLRNRDYRALPIPFTTPWTVKRLRTSTIADALTVLRTQMVASRQNEISEELIRAIVALADSEAVEAVRNLMGPRRFVRGMGGNQLSLPVLLTATEDHAQVKAKALLDSGCTGSCIN